MSNDNRTLRFKDADWFPKEQVIQLQIGGAGGIGSWLAFFLCRIGYAVTQYDFDTVEEHNLAGQLFSSAYVGDFKVEAVNNVISMYAENIMYNPVNDKITEDTESFLNCFSAFDNMLARKILFENWLKAVEVYKSLVETEETEQQKILPIFIDGRLEAEQIQIYSCVYSSNPEEFAINVERYLNTLFLDVEGDEPPCTMKQTSHTAAIIAAKMTCIFTNHVANCNSGFNVRSVPYKYEEFTPAFIVSSYD